ncbi:2-oxoacid:acceptor oxidoreductase family protein [Desulfurobacterium thermolithotrophum]|uniref:2-oxoacid:acceptor oxidoreductase family protein n=1 Tax=Desulfurobacterium thermolithotrophum TaxID=64160 RepID=UPI0013D5A350|nr:2-oxoacid:acceptor oxidoreductase family protein [Desulfurobacterium thermolithotrophum]
MRYEVRVIGSAGQGSILAAVVLANAAAEEGLNATQTATYGAAMRSGVSLGDVVISDEPIDFPKTFNLDAVIIQSQEAYEDMIEGKPMKLDAECGEQDADILVNVKPGALVIIDEDLVQCNADCNMYRIVSAPIARTATEVLGKRQVMNILALGVFQVASSLHFDGKPLISEESFLRAIEKNVPSRFVELNKNAFMEGVKLGKAALQKA